MNVGGEYLQQINLIKKSRDKRIDCQTQEYNIGIKKKGALVASKKHAYGYSVCPGTGGTPKGWGSKEQYYTGIQSSTDGQCEKEGGKTFASQEWRENQVVDRNFVNPKPAGGRSGCGGRGK